MDAYLESKEVDPFEQYFSKKTDKISQEAVRLLDTDLKNGNADIFLLTDNVYAHSKVGQVYNWISDGWDNPQPDNPPNWFDSKELFRESDKKMPRGYKLNAGTVDILAEKKLYDLKPVAEVAYNKRTKIQDPEHLNKALKFAAQLPEESRATLGRCFDSLDGFLNEWYKTYELTICPDFVPHSFYWYFSKGDEQGMNGGVILHGFCEPFAVELEPKRYPHWSVHT